MKLSPKTKIKTKNKEVSASRKKTSEVLFRKKSNVKPREKIKNSKINNHLQTNNFIKGYKQVNNKISKPHTTRMRGFFDWYEEKIGALKPLAFISILLILGVASIYYYNNYVLADSASYTIDSKVQWEAGEYYPNQLDTITTANSLQIKAGGVGSWDPATPGFPENVHGYNLLNQEPANAGTDITTDGTYIYMIIGGNQPGFFRYNPELNIWKTMTSLPTSLYYGAALTYYDGYVYASASHHDNTATSDDSAHFLRFDVLNNSWEWMEDAPGPWGRGADIEAASNGIIYAVQGESESAFWQYDTSPDSGHWSVGTGPDIVTTTNSHPLLFSNYSFGADPVYCQSGCMYLLRGGNREFFRYDIALDTWAAGFADLPVGYGNVTNGSAMAFDSVNHDLYLFRGGATTFARYQLGDPGEWDEAVDTTKNPWRSVTTGASMIYLDGYVYATFGGIPEFGRFNTGDGTNGYWDAILTQAAQGTNADGLIAYVDDTPDSPDCDDGQVGTRTGCLYVAQGGGTGFRKWRVGDQQWDTLTTIGNSSGTAYATGNGASMCYDGNENIYIARGGNLTNVYVYRISDNSFPVASQLTAAGAIEEGASITCMGDNHFFLLRGNTTNDLYHYNAGWQAAETVPLPGGASNRVYWGGALTHAGTDVYVLAGYYRGNFYKYDSVGDTWNSDYDLPYLPTSSYYTTTMEYDGNDAIYAITGLYNTDFWRYDITDKVWTHAADLPQRFGYSHGLALDSDNHRFYVLRGGAPSTNAISIHKFNYETDPYIPSAKWISAPFDLNYVAGWENFSATHPTDGTSAITFDIRSSDNGADWSDWETIVNNSSAESTSIDISGITTDPNRYVQIRVTFTSDNNNTPVLEDFNITYTKDSTAPINPTAIGYTDSTQATGITSGNTYYGLNPYFELAGSTDAHSGVAGYYAAWVTSADASFNPSTSEDYYQTETTYQVTADRNGNQMTDGTYYLRVAAKDNAGNVTPATSVFTYVYQGIDTSSTKVWDDQDSFGAIGTTATNINTQAASGDQMTLWSLLDDTVPGDNSGPKGAWTNEASLPLNVTNGSGLAFDGNDTIYILRGTNTQTFWKYSVSNKIYTALEDYGSNVNVGSSMVYVPYGVTSGCTDAAGCIFATQGNAANGTSTIFQRFDPSADANGAWTALNGPSYAPYQGSSLAYDGNNTIYYHCGYSYTTPLTYNKFYKYNIQTGLWTSLTDSPDLVRYGGTMTYVPHGDYCSAVNGCVYVTKGNNDTEFMKYSAGASGGSWSYVANTPIWFGDGAAGRYGGDGYIYYVRGYVSFDSYRYDVLNDRWELLAKAPSTLYQGSEQGLAYDSNTGMFYSLRGYSDYSMYKYDKNNDTWANTPGLPHYYTNLGFYYGATAYDSATDIMYVARGNSVPDWLGYHVSENRWEELANVPMRVRTGSDAEYVNHTNDLYDGVYLLSGEEGLGDDIGYFFRYNTKTDTWTRLKNMLAEPNYGSDLVWDGANALYTARGGSSNNRYFYKYTIDTDTWEQIGTANNIPNTIYTGACAVKATQSGHDYIYMTRGAGNAQLYRYDLSDPNPLNRDLNWSTMTAAPGGIQYGDTCVLDNQGNILVPRGNVAYPNEMYVYNIEGDSWTTRNVLQYYEYGSLVTTANNVVMGFRGESTSAMDRYVVATNTTGYKPNGTWTSEITDFSTGVYAYGAMKATITNDDPSDNTSVIFETRTCSDDGCSDNPDDAHWSSWTAVDDGHEYANVNYFNVDSPVARYGQVRARYTSDQVKTPSIDDITWNYFTDSTAPNNPGTASAYTDSGKMTGISDSTWTSDATPYLEWTATDNVGGIGVEGFYVYFGTDNTKDPIDDASDPTNLAYVSGTNYYAVAGDGTTGSWNALTQSVSALTSGTYYMIIRSSDYNANTASSSGVLFTFELDIGNPVRPASVTADPGSWTSINDFDFSWTAANDVGGSGIKEYCYTINEGAQTCVLPTSVTGILATQTRENAFCVYAVDNADNVSSTCREKTFYYAGNAPTAPQNITIDPVTTALSPQEDVNSFSITWDLPSECLGSDPGDCDGDDVLRYCYTINELPSADTCGTNIAGSATPSPDGGWTTTTQTSSRSLLSFSAAVQQGLNTIYIVTADLINNIDYDNYESADYYFSSNAPGIPASAAVTDTSDRATQKYSVVMTWDEPADVGSGVTGYNVYRCEADCENPDAVDDPPTNYTKIATVNTLGYLDTSLDTLITYSYFARAAGTGGVQSGNSSVLQIKPEGKFKFAPLLSGQPQVTPYIRSALVEWLTLNDTDQYGNSISHPASSFVEYGETVAYGGETGTSDLVNEHEVTLTNLSPDTTYHYRTKWTDVDGNTSYSPDFEFTTKGAPSPPINVAVTPTSNTTNSFTFSWDPPTDEGVTIAGYYYTINNNPNEDNVTRITEDTLGPIDAATQQGTNTFYVVAFDDTGNVNYTNYATVGFIANTTPPDSPQAVTITDSSDRDAKRYSITVTWDPPEGFDLEDEIYYTIERSIGIAPDQSAAFLKTATEDDFSEIATITSTGYLDTGLDSSKEYFYKITAQDKAQAMSDPTEIVSEVPEGRFTKPPAITEAPVASPDSFSANITWRTERIASSFVEFGTTSSALEDLDNEQGTADLIESHDIKVTGLTPEKTYYYRVKSIDIDENAAYSEVGSFTTLEAPRVLELDITDIKLFDAIVSWQTNKDTTAIIQYGPTSDYGFSYTDTTGSLAKTHTVKLENLKESTTYHLTISGVDSSGNPISSDDYTFTTLTFPEVLDITYENKAEGQTEVYWKTNVPATSSVEYYNENIAPKTQGNAALTKDHAILLFGLEDATTYKFKIHGSDEFGYEAVSDEREFTTLEDTTPPEIFSVQSESNTIGSGESSKIQIVISWKTDEPTTSQVEYGVGLGGSDYTDQTEENAELVMDHLAVISDLTPAKTYHFRVVSSDKANNQTKSGSYTVLTSRKRESFLQLIISNLEETFSWIGNIGSLVN